MVNFSDPGVILGDLGARAFGTLPRRVSRLMSLSLDSGAPHPLPYHKWYLPVGLLIPLSTCRSHLTNPTRSWEFFTNLDYEFGIIRGRRPYRWTIWVRNSGLCFWASRPRLSLGLNAACVDLLLCPPGYPFNGDPQLGLS